MDIIELAEQNQQNAWKLLDETGIIPAWERIGATVHLVGSLKSGLLMNLVHTEEECIEWHALYEDQELHTWKFDLIHIRKGSKYDGVVENVTAAIAKLLTPGLRETILRIKYEVPDGVMIPGIEIYHAVFTGDVRSYEELERWRQEHPLTNSLDWLP